LFAGEEQIDRRDASPRRDLELTYFTFSSLAKTPRDLPRALGVQFCIWVLPFVVFVLLYSWRPFKLGFYSDDWYVLLHPEPGTYKSLLDIFGMYQNRPAAAPVVWLAQLAIDWRPARAQLANIVLLAATAYSVGLFTYSLAGSFSGSRDARLWGGGLAAALYLAFPWAPGFSAWATAATAVAPATIWFCLASHLLVRKGGDRIGSQLAASFLMGMSFLTYEAFYGQFAFILLIMILLRGNAPIWSVLRPGTLLLLTNISCAIYNRSSTGGVRKTFAEDWWSIFVQGYIVHFADILRLSFPEVAKMVAASFAIGLVFGLFCLARIIGIARTSLALLAAVAGVCAAGVLYAAAGYELSSIGVMGRTTAVLSIYAAVALGVLGAASVTLRRNDNLSAWVQISASLLLVASFAWASLLRLGEWAKSWNAQLEVLHQLPAGPDKQFSSNARFLYLSPAESQKIPLASAPWEISGALAYATFLRSPLAGRNTMADNWTGKSGWFAESPGWFTSWDGETMSQGFCWNQLSIYSMKADEIWLWKAGEQPGFRIGCPGVPK
jgi:hypothetical protein